VAAVAQRRLRQWLQRGSRCGSAASVAAALRRWQRQRREAEVTWGGGGGRGGMIKGGDKQQSNNGCVGKWQREQKYEEQNWMVVGECGRFRRLATQLQRLESHGNKDLGMNGMDYVVSQSIE
jgi:hypothetical protein